MSLKDHFSDIASDAPEPYLQEPRGAFYAPHAVLLRPRTTQEVSDVLAHCNSHGIKVVPYGGGTGLVGGQVDASGGYAILSLERMNKMRSSHPDENVLVVEAGTVLEDIHAMAEDMGRLFPLNLGSKGSARLGGLLGTNAGGVGVLRYGNARDLCLGIEAVFADGTIFDGLKRLRKDNTGYDLRHLMIGAEGTLGVITAASLKLFAQPQEQAAAFIEVPSPRHAISLLTQLQTRLDGLVSAFELISGVGQEFVKEHLPQTRLPFAHIPTWSVLLEVGAGEGSNLEARILSALEHAFETGDATDAVLAQSAAQRDAFWALREAIPEANRIIGAVASHDISLPISEIPDFIDTMPAAIHDMAPFVINCFGHLGDGNLHYNVFPPQGRHRDEFANLKRDLMTLVHDEVVKRGGSFSAEHGIGRLKADDLQRYGDSGKLHAMRQIKAVFDPTNIMNPGVMFEM